MFFQLRQEMTSQFHDIKFLYASLFVCKHWHGWKRSGNFIEVRKLAVDLHQYGHRLCETSQLLQLPDTCMTVSNIIKRVLQS